MNPVTFNDSFQPILSAMQIPPPEVAGINKSPLVEWKAAANAKLTLDDTKILVGPDNKWRLPFDKFRVYADLSDYCAAHEITGLDAHTQVKLVIARVRNHTGFVALYESKSQRGFAGFRCHEDGKRGALAPFIWCPTKGFLATGHENPNYVTMPSTEAWDQITRRFVTIILLIASDFVNPHLHSVKVAPKLPAGKSIVWQTTRTYYTLIHKSHPANRKESHGTRKIDCEPQILRCAHSRRAHFRLLKSPKFKHKQGQRIWVKSMWVGPKEWEDSTGHIYKIVDPQPEHGV